MSRFIFDGVVFDAGYFRQKMAESRQRRRERRERVKAMLAESRSAEVSLAGAQLNSVPGLVEALNALTSDLDGGCAVETRSDFNLRRYEDHIQALVHDVPLSLKEIPPLGENLRQDLIWRFIAVVFLAHLRVIEIWQEGGDVMVIRNETDRERQDLSGGPESPDGVERPLGRADAC